MFIPDTLVKHNMTKNETCKTKALVTPGLIKTKLQPICENCTSIAETAHDWSQRS